MTSNDKVESQEKMPPRPRLNHAPENVLSANRRRRLLFPTPEEKTQAQDEV